MEDKKMELIELEYQREFYSQLVRSCEAKITKVDPLSEEFFETVDTLVDAKRKIEEVAPVLAKMRMKFN